MTRNILGVDWRYPYGITIQVRKSIAPSSRSTACYSLAQTCSSSSSFNHTGTSLAGIAPNLFKLPIQIACSG
ncbi:hypothetical protein [Entomobacter blattae]|uniref:hypothetical protein n=1 Tax=Entomobacter blattae TaxID=2762277 RepID=UPI00193BF813|nr:hypothetical protein [Entomobacter blattae]